MKIFSSLCFAASITASCVVPQSAFAGPIDYIFQGTAAGTLDGQAFSGLLTVTASGDTANVFSGGTSYTNNTVTTVIDVPGLGQVSITGSDYVFDSQSANKIGYGVTGIPHCCDIIQFIDPAYGTYDLMSSIGPLAYPTDLSIGDWIDVPTSGGLLTLSLFENNSFQAIATTVPEPLTLSLFGAGFAGAVALRRRRGAIRAQSPHE